MDTMNCKKCGNEFEGYRCRRYCDDCRSPKTRYMAEYYKKNRERVLATNKKWSTGNINKLREYKKQYRLANLEKTKKHINDWHETHRERIKQIESDFYYRHKDEIAKKTKEKRAANVEEARTKKNTQWKRWVNTERGRMLARLEVERRLANLRNIKHEFTAEQWMQKVKDTKGICPECAKDVGEAGLTLHHIYPVSVANKDFQQTGEMRVYTIEDVQPLCKSCNCSRHNEIVCEIQRVN